MSKSGPRPSGPPTRPAKAIAPKPKGPALFPQPTRPGGGGDVLFIHNNFPGQFGFLAEALQGRNMRVAAVGGPTAQSPTVPIQRWALTRGTGKDIFPLAVRAEADLIRGKEAAEAALKLKAQGFAPRVIIGHPGWGETCLMKEVFPDVPQILHGEFYYRTRGADVGFDPEFGAMTQEERFRVAGKNAVMASSYLDADRIVCPTPFQASLFPQALQSRIRIVHEGVDTQAVQRRTGATLTLPDSRILDGSTPVITYVGRSFEPLRGFHVFMRALPTLLQTAPQAEVVVIGDDKRKGYGAESQGGTWAEKMLAELGDRLDRSRVHFLGRVPHPVMLDALSLSAGHVYFTYPFVLSWSLLEAMACECLILGSDTAPVRDAIQDGVNGRLLDFFDPQALGEAMIEACRQPAASAPLRSAARETVVARFDRASRCLPAWLAMVDGVLAGV